MRTRDASSFAVVCSMPLMTTAVRLRPAALHRARPSRRGVAAVPRQTASYCIDSVLGDSASQQQTYDTLVAPLVDGLLQGDSAVLLVYGAAQTGKTHSLQGTGDSAGVIQLAVQHLTRSLAIVPSGRFRLSATCCALSAGHEAALLDSLAPAHGAAAASLREGCAAAAVAGLTRWSLQDPTDIREVLRCRQQLPDVQAGTSSSRGAAKGCWHSMLTLQLDSSSPGDPGAVRSSRLSFVELAAPEPKQPPGLNRSSEGANAASRSLAVAYSSLGKVLSALRRSAAPSSSATAAAAGAAALASGCAGGGGQLHVPWRDSALTRWLQEHLNSASAITLLGTVSMLPECAADSLATISWISRFTRASRAGPGGVLASFAWEAVADPDAAPGSMLRFQPAAQVIRGCDDAACSSEWQSTACSPPKQHITQQQQQQQPKSGGFVPSCGSSLVNQDSPNLQPGFCGGGSSSMGWAPQQRRPASAGSVSHQPSAAGNQPRQAHHHQQQQEPGEDAGSDGLPITPQRAGAAATADDGCSSFGQLPLQLPDEAQLAGELMRAVQRGGGGLRGEAILEHLLQQLSAARAGLMAGRGDCRALRDHLAELQAEHGGCNATRTLLQETVLELQQQLRLAQTSLAEVASDRDMFLRRLQQLEEQAGSQGCEEGRSRPVSRLELQRHSAHAQQLHLLESELSALASSNQQLRNQLELHSSQLSKASRERGAALEAAGEAAERAAALQQEVEMLRSAADIEAAIRQEMQLTIGQLQQSCSSAEERLAAVLGERDSLQQQLGHSQAGLDAVAGELQEVMARAEAAEAAVGQLSIELEAAQQQQQEAAQQVSGLKAEAGALEELKRQLQQQATALAEAQQAMQDVQQVIADFEEDLPSALAPQWRALIEDAQAAAGASLPPRGAASPPLSSSAAPESPQSHKLRSRLLRLVNSSSSTRNGLLQASTGSLKELLSSSSWQQQQHPAAAAAARQAALSLPGLVARKLGAVVEVLQLSGDEQERLGQELQGSRQRAQLLESNVNELHKLVATQEELQGQLSSQLSAAQGAAAAEASSVAGLKQQLEEAQAAVAALADELQEAQNKLSGSQAEAASLAGQLSAARGASADRDQALDVLADELVEAAAAQRAADQRQQEAEEQVMELASELEEALLQLSLRDQVLDQVIQSLPEGMMAASSGNNGHNNWDGDSSWDQNLQAAEGDGVCHSDKAGLFKSTALERLQKRQQQQQQRQEQHEGGCDQRSAAASLAHQALTAAKRRSTQDQQQQDSAAIKATSPSRSRSSGRQQSTHHADGGSSVLAQPTAMQQLQQLQQRRWHAGQQQSSRASCEKPLLVAAVQHLRDRLLSLEQQLADAQTADSSNRSGTAKLRQQLADARQQHEQLLATLDEAQQGQQQLQGECQRLRQDLRAKEQQLQQLQEHCEELEGTVRQLQQQRQVAPGDQAAHAQLQLSENLQQLSAAKASLQAAHSELAAERAARRAAEDAQAGQQQLLQRLADLQAELSALHGQLLDGQRGAAKLREELALLGTSRDTWRDAARKAEAAVAEARAAGEARSLELTRARAELLQLRQQLGHQAADAGELLQLAQPGLAVRAGGPEADGSPEGLAARLAATQVLRRDAEARAASLAARLAAAESQLAHLAELQADDDKDAELAGRVDRSLQEVQAVRLRADLAAQRAAAEEAAGQVAELSRQLQQQDGQLAAAQQQRDALRLQLQAVLTQRESASLLQQQQGLGWQRGRGLSSPDAVMRLTAAGGALSGVVPAAASDGGGGGSPRTPAAAAAAAGAPAGMGQQVRELLRSPAAAPGTEQAAAPWPQQPGGAYATPAAAAAGSPRSFLGGLFGGGVAAAGARGSAGYAPVSSPGSVCQQPGAAALLEGAGSRGADNLPIRNCFSSAGGVVAASSAAAGGVVKGLDGLFGSGDADESTAA